MAKNFKRFILKKDALIEKKMQKKLGFKVKLTKTKDKFAPFKVTTMNEFRPFKIVK